MKKRLILFNYLIISSLLVLSQAKKPSIMIVPSDNWCHQNKFEIISDDQGKKIIYPDYEAALRESSDLVNVITKINGLMFDRGFPLNTLEDALKKIKESSAEEMVIQSKSTGSGVGENAYEKLTNVAKSDIILKLGWTVTPDGLDNSVQINLEAIDTYTGKSIAAANPPGKPSATDNIPVLLSEAVLSIIDNFNSRLQSHFEDLFTNGREAVVKLSRFDSWQGDFESEYEINGEKKELSEIIEDWMSKNTVKGKFNNSDATENKMVFNPVRIPMYDASGKAIDCKDFCKPLQKYLQGPPFNIPVKLIKKGLGQTWLILGEK